MNMPDMRTEVQVKHIPLWSLIMFGLTMAFSIGGLYVTVSSNTDAIIHVNDELDESKQLERKSIIQATLVAQKVGRIERTLDKITDKIEKIAKDVKQ